nr:hypothetical protein SYMBAF_100215 [Serratia symbiotica]
MQFNGVSGIVLCVLDDQSRDARQGGAVGSPVLPREMRN